MKLATWTIKIGKITSTTTLKILVADSPAALHQINADQTREPEILHWQKDAESMWKDIKNDPGPSLPGQNGIKLAIIPIQYDLPQGPGRTTILSTQNRSPPSRQD